MKKFMWMLTMFVLVGVTCGEAQTVQAGIFSSSPTSFVVRAKVSGGGFTDIAVTNIVVTVYWETAAGITLGAITSPDFVIKKAGVVGTEGPLSYQKFASTPDFNITWTDGTVADLFTMAVTAGTGPAIFQLGQPAGGSGDWFFEVFGADYTNTSTPFYAATTELALPVTLVSFSGSASVSKGGVVLEWKTASEVNNYGYTVQRQGANEADFTDLKDAFIAGKGTTVEPQQYSYVDKSIAKAGTYTYRLKQQDLDGGVHYTQSVIVQVTVTDVAEVAPRVFQLTQNYPNPFNPSTQIKFSVESTERATVKVYNMLGAEVATLFDGTAEAGRYYVAKFDAAQLASGIYFYRLTTEKKTDVKRMLLVK